MVQEKEKAKLEIESEIHALKAAISKIRNLEAMERDFNRVKERADRSEELVDRWNRFYYESKDKDGTEESDDRRKESNDTGSFQVVSTTPDGESGNHGEDDENSERGSKRARVYDVDT